MSKKNRQFQAQSQQGGGGHLYAEEHRIIKRDLLKVLVLNVIYLSGVLALYFTNAKTHYLEGWFEKILHF